MPDYNVKVLKDHSQGLKTVARAINSNGIIVGHESSDLYFHAAVWHPGQDDAILFQLPDPHTFSSCKAINDNDQVIGNALNIGGWYSDLNTKDGLHFLPNDGPWVSITAVDINNKGLIAVKRVINDQNYHACVYHISTGTYTDIHGIIEDRLQHSVLHSEPIAITNTVDESMVLGRAKTNDGKEHVFYYEIGTTVFLEIIHSDDGLYQFVDMNNNAQIVCYNSYKAFQCVPTWTSGRIYFPFTKFDYPVNYRDPVPRAINDNGEAVGNITDTNNESQQAFIRDDAGEIKDLQYLIPSNSQVIIKDAVGINNKGDIICSGLDWDNNSISFLLTRDYSISPDLPPGGTGSSSGPKSSKWRKSRADIFEANDPLFHLTDQLVSLWEKLHPRMEVPSKEFDRVYRQLRSISPKELKMFLAEVKDLSKAVDEIEKTKRKSAEPPVAEMN